MGITGTEVAKEVSAIILMDDNFTSVANEARSLFTTASTTPPPTLVVPELVWANLIMDNLTYPRRVLDM